MPSQPPHTAPPASSTVSAVFIASISNCSTPPLTPMFPPHRQPGLGDRLPLSVYLRSREPVGSSALAAPVPMKAEEEEMRVSPSVTTNVRPVPIPVAGKVVAKGGRECMKIPTPSTTIAAHVSAETVDSREYISCAFGDGDQEPEHPSVRSIPYHSLPGPVTKVKGKGKNPAAATKKVRFEAEADIVEKSTAKPCTEKIGKKEEEKRKKEDEKKRKVRAELKARISAPVGQREQEKKRREEREKEKEREKESEGRV